MITRKQVSGRTTVSGLTLSRLVRSESAFPQPEKHGKNLYFDWDSILKWLESRASKAITLEKEDCLWDSKKVSAELGRSLPWINQKLIKSGEFTRFNLAPSSNPKSIKNYFLAREIIEAFPELIEIAKHEGDLDD